MEYKYTLLVLFIIFPVIGFNVGYGILKKIYYSKNYKYESSIPSNNDVVLDKLPNIQKKGEIYYYQTRNGIESSLNGKIIEIKYNENALLIGEDIGNRVWIHLNEYTKIYSVEMKTGKNYPIETHMYSIFKINDFVSVGKIKYINNKYYGEVVGKVI